MNFGSSRSPNHSRTLPHAVERTTVTVVWILEMDTRSMLNVEIRPEKLPSGSSIVISTFGPTLKSQPSNVAVTSSTPSWRNFLYESGSTLVFPVTLLSFLSQRVNGGKCYR